MVVIFIFILIIFIFVILWRAGWFAKFFGTGQQKDFFHRLMTWVWKDSPTNLFLRIDPYKPLPEALKEMADNAWPTEERLDKWLLWTFMWVCIIILIGLIAVTLVNR